MDAQSLAQILDAHRLWLADPKTGSRADLRGADLSGADLHGADLRRANLYRANLSGANLHDANLYGAYLRDANLRKADLGKADLSAADLSAADLSGANLVQADLSAAYLRDANLRGADLGERSIVPMEGAFVGYKKVSGPTILRLEIRGARTSNLVGRKCRTNRAFVLGVVSGPAEAETTFSSLHDPTFLYTVGTEVVCHDYDPDGRVECTRGVHFFLTQEEAEAYGP